MNGILRLAEEKSISWVRGRWVQVIGSYWPLLLIPLLALSILNRFPYPSAEARFSDLVISHYPNTVFLLHALREWSQVPLWSPMILGGYPFGANPLVGLWYPPGWLALIFPLPFGFNLTVTLHLLWGGLGMYRLLREQGLGHCAGLCGALAFQAMPKLFAHYGAGHLTLLYAVPWTPWLIWAWQRGSKEGGHPRKGTIVNFLPGIVLGMIFLADLRWAVYAGILWWAWALAHRQKYSLLNTIKQLFGQTLFAGLVAAPLALPLLEYTILSTRASLSTAEARIYSLPPVRLLGLFFPGIHGNHEWALYPGALVLLLAGCALVTASSMTASSLMDSSSGTPDKVRKTVRFWAWTAFLAILISLGENLPGYELLASLPGFALLRVPARALFLSGFAFAVLAAYGLEGLLTCSRSVERRRAEMALVALTAFPVALAGGALLSAGELPAGFAWGGAVFMAGGCWLGIRMLFSTKPPPAAWLAGLFLLGLLDLGAVDLQSFAARSSGTVLAEGEAAAVYLARQPGVFRVYSPSYSLPQQTAARYGMELADGVDPLQLESLAEFIEKASGVPRNGYSVTIPPYHTGSPEVDNRAYLPNPELLGWLNVAYVLSEYDLPVPGLVLKKRFGDTRVYENESVRPRAWVQPSVSGEIASWREATLVDRSPNEITISARGPGLLVLSEVAYPGWQVWVDGEREEIERVRELFRGVQLGPGEHQVIFRYRPASVIAGLILAVVAVLFLAVTVLQGRSHRTVTKA